jgi:hypothetical protein
VSAGRIRVADAVSLAFNPSVWSGGFVACLAAVFCPPGAGRWVAGALGFGFVGLVPVGLLFVLRALGRLSDVEMRIRSEREVVYLACAVSFAVGAVALRAVGAAWPVWGLVALHVPYALVLAAVNRRWKVSIHTAGLAGVFAAGLVLFGVRAWPLAAALLVGGWARWAAGAHSLGQLAAGAAIGFVLTGGGLLLLRLLVGG